MTDPGSSLAAALAEIESWHQPILGAAEVRLVLAAARERLRLSKIPCETCGGRGKFWIDAYSDGVCRACGGSGEAWAAALIRVVMVGDFRAVLPRGEAIAILDAIDLYAKEATK